MTEAMPFLQKYDITFLRPPVHCTGGFFVCKCYGKHRANIEKRIYDSKKQGRAFGRGLAML